MALPMNVPQNKIGIRGAVALGITFRTLAVSTEIILHLLHARNDGDQSEADRIHLVFQASPNFCFEVRGAASGT